MTCEEDNKDNSIMWRFFVYSLQLKLLKINVTVIWFMCLKYFALEAYGSMEITSTFSRP